MIRSFQHGGPATPCLSHSYRVGRWTLAQAFSQINADQVIDRALNSLASILETGPASVRREFKNGFTYDWQSDRFSRGAYSYALVGGSSAGCAWQCGRRTLFFAGEATDCEGHNGTVHGAIASGRRAAKEILAAGSPK